jgi:hypothetical protein
MRAGNHLKAKLKTFEIKTGGIGHFSQTPPVSIISGLRRR